MKKALFDFRNSRWEEKLQSLSTEHNSVWKVAKALRNYWNPLPPIHGENGIVYTDEDKAKAHSILQLRTMTNSRRLRSGGNHRFE